MVKQFTALGAAQVIRTGRSLLRGLHIKAYKVTTPELYIQIFNNASPTLGTTAPNEVIRVPAGDSLQPLHDRWVRWQDPKGGEEFSTALTIACTTTHDGSVLPTSGDEPHVTIDYEQVGA